MLKIIFFVCLRCVFQVQSIQIEALHEYMNAPELEYYFNTEDKSSVPDYEVVYLPPVIPIREPVNENGEFAEIDYNFSAFGGPISLKLKRNSRITASNFKTYVNNEDGTSNILPYTDKYCHYLHKDETSVAAISICQPKSVHGFLFLQNSTLELQPLTPRLQTILHLQEPLVETLDDRVPHIVRRAPIISHTFHDDAFPIAGTVWDENPNISKRKFLKASHRPALGLIAEVALFFDPTAYVIFSPYMNYDDSKMRDMLLAYMNGIQALYHHPSIGTTLDLVLVRLDIMKTQPAAMPHYDGERSKLLDSFCSYQRSINPGDDTNPDHWDMALYVSGLDFFAYENGRKSGVTMGLATVGGVCLEDYNCVIAEMGTTNALGKPYPSAGFTSVYILAHEIGHNLGMHHDGSGNNCPKEGYIMSPSRGTNGETQWSTCSADVMSKLSYAKCLNDYPEIPATNLDHTKFLDMPGQIYTAKKQCEVLLQDRDAVASPNQDLPTICYSLQCKTPHRSGYYFAGPALEGTECGRGQICYGGSCVSKTIPNPVTNKPGGWGPWKLSDCNSGCLIKSKGFQGRRRTCNNPAPINTDKGCEGSSYSTVLCKDDKPCGKRKRKSVVDYASEKCKEFSKLIHELDPKGVGLQAPHEEGRLWMGCAIFCRRKDAKSYYTPRIELNDLGVSPYFPDGTWCHNKGSTNYYCLQHHCLPENFELMKTSFINELGEDIPISQNAHPHSIIPPQIKSYLSLGPDGQPMRKTLKPEEAPQPRDEDWETDDYIELPQNKLNEIFQ